MPYEADMVVTVPEPLAPKTIYHVEVKARYAASWAALTGVASTSFSDPETVILTTLRGKQDIYINSETGNNTKCYNSTENATAFPCKTIEWAMEKHQYESFEFIVEPGTYTLTKELVFVEENMQIFSRDGLVGDGAVNATKLICTVRCLNLDIVKKHTIFDKNTIRAPDARKVQ